MHVILHIRLSHFSACYIENLGMGLGIRLEAVVKNKASHNYEDKTISGRQPVAQAIEGVLPMQYALPTRRGHE